MYVFNPFSGTLDWTASEPTVNQVPVETPDGVTTVFTLPNGDAYVATTLQVFLNGVLQKITNDFSETSPTTFTFNTPPLSSDLILLAYRS